LLVYIEASIAFGLPRSLILTPLSTLLGFLFALLHASQRLGRKRALMLLACVFVVSLTFESVGVATGLVYGPYHYDSRKLGPLLFDLVPPLIPVAWFLMMYPSLVMAERLTPAWERTKRLLTVAALGGLIMTAWDLVMDPVMVRGKHWVWEVDGAYFGIPPQNFWGWWLTAFIAILVFLRLSKPVTADETNDRFDRLAVICYAVTGAGHITAALLGGLNGPALVGFFAMMPWVVMGWLNPFSKRKG
jgi:putative membrane protein